MPIPLDPVASTYRDLLQILDSWFATARANHPGVLPCGIGCTACCHGPFDISVADVLLMREAFHQLPPADRDDVRVRADVIAELIRLSEPEWRVDEGIAGLGEDRFDRLAETLAREPCPFLDDSGKCRIYADRPLICRVMGLGLRTPAGRIIDNACPILDQFPEYAALPPQLLDLEALEAEETACLEAASMRLFGTPLKAGFETTIALAISGVQDAPGP